MNEPLEYCIVHLKNGVTLYTKDEVKLGEDVLNWDERGEPDSTDQVIALLGLDGEKYECLRSEICLTHYSTPDSRLKLNELRFALKKEDAEFSEAKMQAMVAEHQRRQEEEVRRQNSDQRVDKVADALLGSRPMRVNS